MIATYSFRFNKVQEILTFYDGRARLKIYPLEKIIIAVGKKIIPLEKKFIAVDKIIIAVKKKIYPVDKKIIPLPKKIYPLE